MFGTLLVQHISPSLLQFGGFFWLDTWLLVDEQTNFTHFLKSSLSVWLSASAFFKKVTTSILFFYFLLEAKAFLQITFTFASFISFFLFVFYLLITQNISTLILANFIKYSPAGSRAFFIFKCSKQPRYSKIHFFRLLLIS